MNLSYKILKLNSGDDVVCKTSDVIDFISNNSILVKDPVVLNYIRSNYGNSIMESYTLTPWFPLANDEWHEVFIKNIISYANANEELKENYIKYLDARKEAEKTAVDVTDEINDSILEEKNERHENGNNRLRRRKIIH